MIAYLVRRTLYGAVTVVGVLLLLFMLFFLVATPDDVARKAIGEKALPEALAQWKVAHGYDKPRLWNPDHPFDTMLADHFRRMLTFDFGRSDADDTPISERLRTGLGPSLSLTVPLFAIGVTLAIALALLTSYLRDSYLDERHSHACAMRRTLDHAPLVQVGIRNMSEEEARALPGLRTSIFYDWNMRNDPN